jgi:hypothetical protein
VDKVVEVSLTAKRPKDLYQACWRHDYFVVALAWVYHNRSYRAIQSFQVDTHPDRIRVLDQFCTRLVYCEPGLDLSRAVLPQ